MFMKLGMWIEANTKVILYMALVVASNTVQTIFVHFIDGLNSL